MQITKKYDNILIIAFGIIYTLLNSYLLFISQLPYLTVASVALLFIVITLRSYLTAFYIITFLTPFSLNLSYFVARSPLDLSLFTEPLLIMIMFILLFKILKNKKIEKQIALHPISKSVIFLVLWILVTAMFSTMPLVSIKYLVSQLWFIIPVFYLGIYIFKDYSRIKKFLWLFSIAAFITVIYSTIELTQASMAKNAAHFVVRPFYKDHTIYGAVMALLTPIWWGNIFTLKKRSHKIYSLILALGFTIGVFLSYSRASWLGLLLAIGVFVIIKLKIKFRYIVYVIIVFGAIIFSFWQQILNTLEKNDQDSSSNISHHISSITNISTDASNTERLNRWYCAIKMFEEKPITGWGPGTYQFQYAPFQLERMRTIISTNSGDVGNAHSEYLGPLAEQGVLGTVAFILLVIAIITTGLRAYKKANNKEIKILALTITLGFMTYFLHGLLNNFMNTDKITVPFWGLAAILVAIDLYHTDKLEAK